jgi:hypothetical protein
MTAAARHRQQPSRAKSVERQNKTYQEAENYAFNNINPRGGSNIRPHGSSIYALRELHRTMSESLSNPSAVTSAGVKFPQVSPLRPPKSHSDFLTDVTSIPLFSFCFCVTICWMIYYQSE